MRIARFEDIVAWQAARALVGEVYRATSRGTANRDFGYRDQIRRAAISVMNNIAEGFARESRIEFARFLDVARASAREVQSLLYLAGDLEYIADDACASMQKQASETAYLITRLRNSVRPQPPKPPER
jgi:four helix bundle protein